MPALSFGLLSPLPAAYAALRLGRPRLWLAARDAAGRFASLDEMSVLAGLPPALTDGIRDRVVLGGR